MAEKLHDEQDYRQSVIASSKAFHIFLSNINSRTRNFPHSFSGHFLGESSEDAQWKTKVEQLIENHQNLLDLLLQGIDLVDYQKFVALTPNVAMFGNGSFQVVARGFKPMPEHNIEESLFCSRFVLDSVMVAERNQLVIKDQLSVNLPELSVIEATDVIVYPKDQPEVICTLNPGDVVYAFSNGNSRSDGFIRIRFQGDFAFVKESAVCKIEKEDDE